MKIIKMLIFLLSLNLFSEGFYKDTLVQTINGYAKISDLKVGDEVLGFDLKNDRVAIQRVIRVSEIRCDKYCKVNLFDNDVLVHVDQLIYQNSTWIKASELSNEIIKKDINLYRITTYPDHNFFIENHPTPPQKLLSVLYNSVRLRRTGILVHNFAPVILLEAAIEVPAIVQAAGTLIAGFATWFGLKSFSVNNFKKKVKFNSNDKYHIIYSNGKKHGFNSSGQDPEKWWKRIIKRVKDEIERGKIKEGKWEIKVSQSYNNDFGDLIIRGFASCDTVRIGTAFLKMKN
jgi:hypothetical protein